MTSLMVPANSAKHNTVRIIRLTLMVSSIALLLIFQFVWLATSYEQSYVSFRRETSALLRSTVFSIRDSLFVSDLDQILPESFDSVGGKLRARYSRVTILRSGESSPEVDDNMLYTDSGRITRTMTKHLDSIGGEQNFVIRIRADDTLATAMLADRFRAVIAQADYSDRFVIRHMTRSMREDGPAGQPHFPHTTRATSEPFFKHRVEAISDNNQAESSQHQNFFHTLSDTLVTDRVSIGPIHGYAAVFPDMRINVLRRLAPQIMFSIFFTVITVAAFVVMYSNLRSQERVVAMKNDFISNVTHELKTPIATVSVALEALKDFHALKNPARSIEYLDIAQNELNRLSLMTDKILKASVFEQKGVDLTMAAIDLEAIVKQVVSTLKVMLDKKHIQANIELRGSGYVVQGSDMHLTNVVYNLLDNAIKYSPENTSIDILLIGAEQALKLTIRDHGMGIDTIYHQRIFEKFFRVPSGDVHNSRGYGLGLNYVADVMRKHGGTIAVESALGSGSCFTLSIPRAHGS